MDISFYTAKTGAKAQQDRLDIIGNNMANINTAGFKSDRAGFVDLLYRNIREPRTTETQLDVGCGTRVEKTDIDFSFGGIRDTENNDDFVIIGEGFFAVQNPVTEKIYYTRDGSFQKSLKEDGNFYLVTERGELVLGEDMKKIKLGDRKPIDGSGMKIENNRYIEENDKPGVFIFDNYDGMEKVGNNLFSPRKESGEPKLKEDSRVQRGMLEMSNVELSREMVKLIETQKIYNMTLRMIKTSDEIESTINDLRR